CWARTSSTDGQAAVRSFHARHGASRASDAARCHRDLADPHSLVTGGAGAAVLDVRHLAYSLCHDGEAASRTDPVRADARQLPHGAAATEFRPLGAQLVGAGAVGDGRDRRHGEHGWLRTCQAAIQGRTDAVLAVHHVDDVAVRGDTGAAVPRRYPSGHGRYLPGTVTAADGESVQHLPDEAVHPDLAR